MAIVLSASNLVGYVKCKKDAGKDVKSMASNFLGRQILTQVFFFTMIAVSVQVRVFVIHFISISSTLTLVKNQQKLMLSFFLTAALSFFWAFSGFSSKF